MDNQLWRADICYHSRSWTPGPNICSQASTTTYQSLFGKQTVAFIILEISFS